MELFTNFNQVLEDTILQNHVDYQYQYHINKIQEAFVEGNFTGS